MAALIRPDLQETLNELALFAGAGGGILGGILCGFRTVCAVEINEYCQRVLMQRQDDGILEPFPIWPDVTTFDGEPWAGCVDIVTGGFPCQDISAAGRGEGITGARSGLWKEMARIIGEVRPRYVLVENSPMLAVRGLGTVLGDLSALGFDAEWGIVSAAGLGAPHERERIWIVAHAELSERRQERQACYGLAVEPDGVLGQWEEGPGGARSFRDALANGRRMDDGVGSRVDRLRAIGNGQVPAVVRAAWSLLR
jgi:DNA (cytosine-5)-methyltransferase 1